MADLCTGCMCSERILLNISSTDIFPLYLQILNEIPVYGSHLDIQLCWECCHLLGKFQQFKDLVKSSYIQLIQYSDQGIQDTKHLARTPRLQIRNIISIDYPEIKLEYDSLYFNNDQFDDNFDQFDEAIGQPFSHQFDESSQLDEEDDSKKVKEENFETKPIGQEEACSPCPPEKLGKEEVEMKKDIQQGGNHKSSRIKPKKTKIKIKEVKIKVKKKRKLKKSIKINKKVSCDKNDELANEETPIKEDTDMIQEEKLEREVDIEYEKRDMHETENYDDLPLVSLRNGPVMKPKEPRTKVAPNEKPQCAECGKVFSSRKTLKYHLNVLHKGNNRYPCPQCGKVYQWKSNLGRHIRSHKAREKGELYCAMCDKRFASVATYRQHLSVSKQHVSESEFNFTCDECGKKFVNKTRLRDHIDWEHLQKIKFRCQLCNKPFKCHTSLYVHMNNVHTNKGLKDNLCHVCGKSYQNRAKLRYHIVAMHTSETPYQCEQCSAAFGWYSSLYRHVREVHFKMKIHPSKSKRSKKKLDGLPPMGPPPHLVLPPMTHGSTQEQGHL